MLNDVERVSDNDFARCILLSMIRKITSKTSPLELSKETVIAKGLFFVHLYGAYEFTIGYAVQKTIQLINSSVQIADCEPILVSPSIPSATHSPVWCGQEVDRRHVLFGRIKSSDSIQIDDALLPTMAGNIKYKQLETIWRAFNVKARFPQLALRGKLEELVDNRNAIAHGRESPACYRQTLHPSRVGQQPARCR